jgi:hypothetical protein
VNVKKRLELLEKKLELDSYSVIPKQERVITVSGYAKEERDAKMKERLAELHQKYGHFDESVLTLIFIRFLGTPPLTDAGEWTDLAL